MSAGAFEERGRSCDYAELVRWAAEAPALRSLVDPDDPRFVHPVDMPAAIQEFCRETGQPVLETEGAILRCALESLALKYRAVLGWLEEITGSTIEVIHIVGGGSQNTLLNQFAANACNRPVLAGPVEATPCWAICWCKRARRRGLLICRNCARLCAVHLNRANLCRSREAATLGGEAHCRFAKLLHRH